MIETNIKCNCNCCNKNISESHSEPGNYLWTQEKKDDLLKEIKDSVGDMTDHKAECIVDSISSNYNYKEWKKLELEENLDPNAYNLILNCMTKQDKTEETEETEETEWTQKNKDDLKQKIAIYSGPDIPEKIVECSVNSISSNYTFQEWKKLESAEKMDPKVYYLLMECFSGKKLQNSKEKYMHDVNTAPSKSASLSTGTKVLYGIGLVVLAVIILILAWKVGPLLIVL